MKDPIPEILNGMFLPRVFVKAFGFPFQDTKTRWTGIPHAVMSSPIPTYIVETLGYSRLVPERIQIPERGKQKYNCRQIHCTCTTEGIRC